MTTRSAPPALRKLGQRIAELRGKRSVTQEKLAHDLGMSVRTVAGIELGASTTTERLLEIASALHVELHELFEAPRHRFKR